MKIDMSNTGETLKLRGTLKVKYLDDTVPRIALPRIGDLGIDLYSNETITLKDGERSLISTGMFLEIPEGYALIVKDRSSFSKHGHVVAGVIDSSYRGELKVAMFTYPLRKQSSWSLKMYGPLKSYSGPVTIKKGDRIAQGILVRDYNSEFALEEVQELSDTERGSGGFGSTGK